MSRLSMPVEGHAMRKAVRHLADHCTDRRDEAADDGHPSEAQAYESLRVALVESLEGETYKGGPVAEGDARLASAAPELFRSLEAFVSNVGYCGTVDLEAGHARFTHAEAHVSVSQFEDAVQALRKARGET